MKNLNLKTLTTKEVRNTNGGVSYPWYLKPINIDVPVVPIISPIGLIRAL